MLRLKAQKEALPICNNITFNFINASNFADDVIKWLPLVHFYTSAAEGQKHWKSNQYHPFASMNRPSIQLISQHDWSSFLTIQWFKQFISWTQPYQHPFTFSRLNNYITHVLRVTIVRCWDYCCLMNGNSILERVIPLALWHSQNDSGGSDMEMYSEFFHLATKLHFNAKIASIHKVKLK